MHETGLIKNLFEEIKKQYSAEDLSRISKIKVNVSLFGGIKKEHLKEHFDAFIKNTSWKDVSLEVNQVKSGAPFAIERVEFSPKG